ncbi:MAG TPA: hypothetical protein VEQ63_08360 [Bryobacteraceae bacterium]|nr:hypothetical protein [Bryobacteraceae bacterium]
MLKRIVLSTLFAVVCFAQETLAGKWTYQMDTPGGAIPVVLDLKVEGSTVTGTVGTGERVFKIENGTGENGAMKITFKRDRQGTAPMTYVMTGKVDGKVLKGTTTAEVEGQPTTQEWEAKRS